MTIISSHIVVFRQHWAIRFSSDEADACVIRRPVNKVLNSETGNLGTTYADPNPYEGACIWRPGVALDEEAGEQQVELRFGTLLLPWDTDGIEPDDEAVMSSETDGDLDGKVLVVRNVATDTYNTRRALFCEDNQGG